MNKKQSFFLNNYVFKVANIAGGYDSSAQILEEDLARLGIKLPKKLWFQYKLPGGVSPEKYEMKMAEIVVVCWLKPVDVLIKEGFLEQGNLSDEEIVGVQNYLNSLQPKYLKILDEHVEWVKQNNPELSKINVPDKITQKVDFLNGALYGFGPEEIAHYINRTEKERVQDNKDLDFLTAVLSGMGVRLSYVLCMDNRLMIVEEIEKYLIRSKQVKEK